MRGPEQPPQAVRQDLESFKLVCWKRESCQEIRFSAKVPSKFFYPDFIQILFWSYPDYILIISRFYPDFALILSRVFRKSKFYSDFFQTHFIQILSWFYLDKIWIIPGYNWHKIWIERYGRALSMPTASVLSENLAFDPTISTCTAIQWNLDLRKISVCKLIYIFFVLLIFFRFTT